MMENGEMLVGQGRRSPTGVGREEGDGDGDDADGGDSGDAGDGPGGDGEGLGEDGVAGAALVAAPGVGRQLGHLAVGLRRPRPRAAAPHRLEHAQNRGPDFPLRVAVW